MDNLFSIRLPLGMLRRIPKPDKMEMVIVNMSSSPDEGSKILESLYPMFSARKEGADRRGILRENYNIELDDDMLRSMRGMSIDQMFMGCYVGPGREEAHVADVRALVEKQSMSFDEAIGILGISDDMEGPREGEAVRKNGPGTILRTSAA